MSLLQNITSGPSKNGLRIVIAAQEKVGKTTLTSGAPGVLLVPLEVGFSGVSCAKTPMIEDFPSFMGLLNEILAAAQTGKFPYKTLLLDSVTGLEKHIHQYVISQDPLYKPNSPKKSVTMDSAHGGYGKAFNLANDYFNQVLSILDSLAVYAGMNIVFTAHVFSSTVKDPTVGEYNSWDILLHSPKNEKTYGKREILTQWADIIGFMYEPTSISKANDKAMAMGVSMNKGRVLALSRTPSYTAGNRLGIVGELAIPGPPDNGWNTLAVAIYNHSGINVYNS